jgi:RNA polymerase sigma-70 factor (ECF subfamily)
MGDTATPPTPPGPATSADTEELEHFIERMRRRLLVTAYRTLQDWNASEDALQDAWLRYGRTFGDGPIPTAERGHREGWLVTTVRRCAVDQWRRQVGRGQNPEQPPQRRQIPYSDLQSANSSGSGVIDTAPDPGRGPLAEVVSREIQEAIRACRDRLPEHLRIVLVLSYEEGLSGREMASTLGIPPGTVGSRLHHARAAMLECLRGRGIDAALAGGSSEL